MYIQHQANYLQGCLTLSAAQLLTSRTINNTAFRHPSRKPNLPTVCRRSTNQKYMLWAAYWAAAARNGCGWADLGGCSFQHKIIRKFSGPLVIAETCSKNNPQELGYSKRSFTTIRLSTSAANISQLLWAMFKVIQFIGAALLYFNSNITHDGKEITFEIRAVCWTELNIWGWQPTTTLNELAYLTQHARAATPNKLNKQTSSISYVGNAHIF